MEHPEVSKKFSLSPIWLLPFIALCIGGWLLYASYRDAGIPITIKFASADGITPGKTRVIYRGIPVGKVDSIEINRDLTGVILHVTMSRETRPGLVEDTKFWVVRPEISAGRISGLETLISGSYIAVKKGTSHKETRAFVGLEKPPAVDTSTPGLRVTLKTPKLYSLQRGSRVYTKNLAIGRVDDYKLEKDGTISLHLFIQPEFSHLIREGTKFWNSSGISVTGNLQNGLTVNMESLASLIYGGITCETPDKLKDSPPARSGQVFQLYKDYEQAEYGIPMTLQLATGSGIVAGRTRVLYRGLKVGVVKKLDINKDAFHTVTATILLDPRAEVILRQNTRFWVIRPQVSIDGIKNLETLITGPFITFQPGDGPYRDHFVVESTPMPRPTLRPGSAYVLLSPNSGSLTIGTPVLYRKIVVGEITNIQLEDNEQQVRTSILVYQPYDHLVKTNSIFWNVSGIHLDASLSSIKLNLSSLRSMIAGGITFYNPAGASEAAEPGTGFTLYESFAEAAQAEPALQPRGLILTLTTGEPVPVKVGSPVNFKEIKVGEVMDMDLDNTTRQLKTQILIYEKFRKLVNGSSRFFVQSGLSARFSLREIKVAAGPLDTLINGGISFLTPADAPGLKKRRTFTLYPDREAALNRDKLRLTLHFSQGQGLGEWTKIRYQGIEIGHLTTIRFDDSLRDVVAEAVVSRKTASLFTTGSRLQLVGPTVGLDGIHHLETILTGPFINLQPGPGVPLREFRVQVGVKGKGIDFAGLDIVLESDHRGSLKPGSPIYYRQVPVGMITGYDLSGDGRQVLLRGVIRPEYSHLVHRSTRFWRASGIEVNGGLFSGVSVRTESVEALLKGGVAMATPEGEAMGPPAASGAHFPLADRAEKAWHQWRPDLSPVLSDQAEPKEPSPEPAEKAQKLELGE